MRPLVLPLGGGKLPEFTSYSPHRHFSSEEVSEWFPALARHPLLLLFATLRVSGRSLGKGGISSSLFFPPASLSASRAASPPVGLSMSHRVHGTMAVASPGKGSQIILPHLPSHRPLCQAAFSSSPLCPGSNPSPACSYSYF